MLLDTNAYMRFVKGHAPLRESLERAEEIVFSTRVLGELLCGIHVGRRGEQNRATLQEFLDTEVSEILDITSDVADRYARIFTHLKSNGTPVPTNDMWIAATALEAGARLISYDRHFDAIPGLVVMAP